jgi:hypothetical protein
MIEERHLPIIKAVQTAESHARYAAAVWPREVHWYEMDDLHQQAWLLILLGNTDKEIRARMSHYVKFLQWTWGRGSENLHVVLCADLNGCVTRGYVPGGYHGDNNYHPGGDEAPKPNERWIREKQEERNENRKKGLCGCGKLPDPGYKTCAKCRKASRGGRYSSARKNKNRKAIRAENRRRGLCHCGNKPSKGFKTCDRCRGVKDESRLAVQAVAED